MEAYRFEIHKLQLQKCENLTFAECKRARQAAARAGQADGGIHFLKTYFWNMLNFDVQRRAFKDPIHPIDGIEHRSYVSICSGCQFNVKRLQGLTKVQGMSRNPFTIKPTAKFHELSSYLKQPEQEGNSQRSGQHLTLLMLQICRLSCCATHTFWTGLQMRAPRLCRR
jgi:hypothetical protein